MRLTRARPPGRQQDRAGTGGLRPQAPAWKRARRRFEHADVVLAHFDDGQAALDRAVGAEAEEAVRAGEAFAVLDAVAREAARAAVARQQRRPAPPRRSRGWPAASAARRRRSGSASRSSVRAVGSGATYQPPASVGSRWASPDQTLVPMKRTGALIDAVAHQRWPIARSGEPLSAIRMPCAGVDDHRQRQRGRGGGGVGVGAVVELRVHDGDAAARAPPRAARSRRAGRIRWTAPAARWCGCSARPRTRRCARSRPRAGSSGDRRRCRRPCGRTRSRSPECCWPRAAFAAPATPSRSTGPMMMSAPSLTSARAAALAEASSAPASRGISSVFWLPWSNSASSAAL